MNHRNKRKVKGVLSGFMATTMTVSLLPLPEAQAYTWFSDVSYGHWSTESIYRWAEAGLVSGYSSTYFGRTDYIKRGDFAFILNKLMGYEVTSEDVFYDIAYAEKYYNEALLNLNAAEIMTGRSEGYMGAEDDITRQEACLILAKVFNIEPVTTSVSHFTDSTSIASWAVGYVNAMVERGALGGYEDNSFRPEDNITREQFMTILNRLAPTYYTDDYSDSSLNSGTVVIHSSDYSLSDVNITGDLILAEGVKDGDVKLSNVSVAGNIIVKGGGSATIQLDGVTVGEKLLVSRHADSVHVEISGKSSVPKLQLRNHCSIDTASLSTEGYVGTVEIEAEAYLVDDDDNLKEDMALILSGSFGKLSNLTEGTDLTLSGTFESITLTAGATINGTALEAGSTVDPEELPQFELEEPSVTIVNNYGSAAEDASLVPEATTSAVVTYFNASTGDVEVEITIEDIEDCMLMSNNENAIKIYNPNDTAALDALELSLERKDYTKYSVFVVNFVMTTGISEIPFEVNFKAEDEEPEIILQSNFNGFSNASATVEVQEDGVSTSSGGITTAYIDISKPRNCEPHYLDEYVITSAIELESVKLDSYDDDDDVYTYKVMFDSAEMDEVSFTINFLKVDAKDEIPAVRGSLYYDDLELVSRLGLTNYELNEYGDMVVEIHVKNENLKSSTTVDDVTTWTYYQLKSSLTRAVTILAESGETEKGYGLDFGISLTHEGDTSSYQITFQPDIDLEQVYFSVNTDLRDENIPGMTPSINMNRIANISDYFVVHTNTKSYSTRGTASVQVSIKDLTDITGYQLDVSHPVTVYHNYFAENEAGELEYINGELSDFNVSSLGDGLYEITFTPATYVDQPDGGEETTRTRPVWLEMNLERQDDYVGLFANGEPVTSEDMPYAVKATSLSTGDYDYQIAFKVADADGTLTGSDGYTWAEGDDYDTNRDIALIIPEDYVIGELLKNLSVSVGAHTEGAVTVTIKFSTAARINPEDLAFNIAGADNTVYFYPVISFADATGGTISDYEIADFDETTGETHVSFKVEVTEGYELPSDLDTFITWGTSGTATCTVAEDGVYTATFNPKFDVSNQAAVLSANFSKIVFEEPNIYVTDNLSSLSGATASVSNISDFNVETGEGTVDIWVSNWVFCDLTETDITASAGDQIEIVELTFTEEAGKGGDIYQITCDFVSTERIPTGSLTIDLDFHSVNVEGDTFTVTNLAELMQALEIAEAGSDKTILVTQDIVNGGSLELLQGNTLQIADGVTFTNDGDLEIYGTLYLDGATTGGTVTRAVLQGTGVTTIRQGAEYSFYGEDGTETNVFGGTAPYFTLTESASVDLSIDTDFSGYVMTVNGEISLNKETPLLTYKGSASVPVRLVIGDGSTLTLGAQKLIVASVTESADGSELLVQAGGTVDLSESSEASGIQINNAGTVTVAVGGIVKTTTNTTTASNTVSYESADSPLYDNFDFSGLTS